MIRRPYSQRIRRKDKFENGSDYLERYAEEYVAKIEG
jgi:hypothetical protein